MAEAGGASELVALAAEIVSAFAANNSIKAGEVPSLIRETYGALAGLKVDQAAESPRATEAKPAVSVRKSLASRDHIVSLIDGRRYKVLTRHLKGQGLTPASYRERYGLAKTYPMVAPAFSEARRATALRIGLGAKGGPARSNKTKAAGRARYGEEAGASS